MTVTNKDLEIIEKQLDPYIVRKHFVYSEETKTILKALENISIQLSAIGKLLYKIEDRNRIV